MNIIKAKDIKQPQSLELFGLVYEWIEQNKDKEASHE